MTPERVVVIPPGVDTTHFYPRPRTAARQVVGVDESTFMILFVGRIEPLKGLDTLLRAVKLLARRCCTLQDFTVVIIGGDSPAEGTRNREMERLMALCDRLGLQDLVTFLGKRGQDVLPYYYAAADVVVMPSYYESFGMVALEAMACGTPVVASKVGGLLFTVIDGVTGYHVPSGDAVALSQRLEYLKTHPDVGRQLGQHAFYVARHYAWSQIAERIENLFHEVIDTHRHATHAPQVEANVPAMTPCL